MLGVQGHPATRASRKVSARLLVRVNPAFFASLGWDNSIHGTTAAKAIWKWPLQGHSCLRVCHQRTDTRMWQLSALRTPSVFSADGYNWGPVSITVNWAHIIMYAVRLEPSSHSKVCTLINESFLMGDWLSFSEPGSGSQISLSWCPLRSQAKRLAVDRQLRTPGSRPSFPLLLPWTKYFNAFYRSCVFLFHGIWLLK